MCVWCLFVVAVVVVAVFCVVVVFVVGDVVFVVLFVAGVSFVFSRCCRLVFVCVCACVGVSVSFIVVLCSLYGVGLLSFSIYRVWVSSEQVHHRGW